MSMAISQTRYQHLDGSSGTAVKFTDFNVGKFISDQAKAKVNKSQAPAKSLFTGAINKAYVVLEKNPLLSSVSKVLNTVCSDQAKENAKSAMKTFDRYLTIANNYTGGELTDVCNVVSKLDPDKICDRLGSYFERSTDLENNDASELQSCLLGEVQTPINMTTVSTVAGVLTGLMNNGQPGPNLSLLLQSKLFINEDDKLMMAKTALTEAINRGDYTGIMDALSLEGASIESPGQLKKLLASLKMPVSNYLDDFKKIAALVNKLDEKVASGISLTNVMITAPSVWVSAVAANHYTTHTDPEFKMTNDILSWVKVRDQNEVTLT